MKINPDFRCNIIVKPMFACTVTFSHLTYPELSQSSLMLLDSGFTQANKTLSQFDNHIETSTSLASKHWIDVPRMAAHVLLPFAVVRVSFLLAFDFCRGYNNIKRVICFFTLIGYLFVNFHNVCQ